MPLDQSSRLQNLAGNPPDQSASNVGPELGAGPRVTSLGVGQLSSPGRPLNRTVHLTRKLGHEQWTLTIAADCDPPQLIGPTKIGGRRADLRPIGR